MICFCASESARTHFTGTNRGDVVAMVRLPDYEAETTWKLPVMDKRSLYSHHRVAVGGSCPDGGEDRPEGECYFKVIEYFPCMSDPCLRTKAALDHGAGLLPRWTLGAPGRDPVGLQHPSRE